MTTLEELPGDQHAVLSLLLRRRMRYEQVASALGISPAAVRSRAHSALAVLAPQQARALSATEREQIAEYLLGQQNADEEAATKTALAADADARAWARVLTPELVKLAADTLPEVPADGVPRERRDEIPADSPDAPKKAMPRREREAAGERLPGAAPAEAPAKVAPAAASQPSVHTASSRAPSSRRGGALLLAGIALAAIVAVVLILSGKGSGGSANSGANNSAQQSSARTSPQGSSANGNGKVKLESTAVLTATAAGGAAKGRAQIASKDGKHAIVVEAIKLAPTHGFSYVLWLLGGKEETAPIGKTSVGSSGNLVGGNELPSINTSLIKGIEITRETSSQPTRPGTVVLRGRFVAAQ